MNNLEFIEYSTKKQKNLEILKPQVLGENKEFYNQFTEEELKIATEVHNYIIKRVNNQGYHHVIEKGLNRDETINSLAKKLTEFQESVGTLKI
jgi:hypothetical protein